MAYDGDLALVLAAAAAMLASVAALLSVMAWRRQRNDARHYRRISGSDRDVVDVLLDRVSDIDANRVALERLARLVDATREDVAHSIRHLSVIRYDAFRDAGGRRSFSLALLDDQGDGLVLTSLCSRTDSQTIAKGIAHGRTDGLSPEESEAVGYAMKGSVK